MAVRSRDEVISRVSELLGEIEDIHEDRSRKYGFEYDPLYNFRGSNEYGVAPWVAAQIRRTDKLRRGQALAQLIGKDGGLTKDDQRKLVSDLLEGALYDILTVLLLEDEYGVSAVSDPNEVLAGEPPPLIGDSLCSLCFGNPSYCLCF